MTLIIDNTYIDLIDINKLSDDIFTFNTIVQRCPRITVTFNYTDELYNLFNNHRNNNIIKNISIIDVDIIEYSACIINRFECSLNIGCSTEIKIEFSYNFYEIKQDLIIMRKLKLKKLFNYINN